jgi:predicted AlkP superfamily phosphohydrolase/phosphomutase
LAERGYLVRIDDGLQDDPGLLTNVDWARTRAYGVGLNGLYVNLRGRERRGIVLPAERDALLDLIGQDLLATIDAATGSPAVTRVYRPSEDYPTATYQGLGPDLIVGYAKGTRCSNGSALGATSGPVLSDNTDAWSGDHCMDHTTVPGILFSNRPLEVPVERLQDLGAAVLAEFGLGWTQTQD